MSTLFFLFFICSVLCIPKDYSKKPGIASFRFAKDVSTINYRKQEKCNVDIVMKWKKELQSSCMSTPVAYSFLENGNDDIVVNEAWKYADVVRSDGLSPEGWPYSFGDVRFYSSPIIHDVDYDGRDDIINIDINGNIRVSHLNDDYMIHKIDLYRLPPISIDRLWFDTNREVSDFQTLSTLTSFNSNTSLEYKQMKAFEEDTEEMTIRNQRAKQYIKESIQEVTVDAHVLTSPGKYLDSSSMILYIPITYYFSDQDYPNGITGITKEKYLACGVTAFNLTSNTLLWSHIYGLSSMLSTKSQAWIYSTPITVDLEGMGSLSTIFGTSLGLLYAVDEKGRIKRGFPVHFNEIRMTPVCVDLVRDSYLEIIVGDMQGIIAVLDNHGEEIWYTIVSGSLSQSVAIADVNHDHQLDVIAVTDNGDVWALNGANGHVLPNFPIKLGRKVHHSPLTVQLSYVMKDKDVDIVIIGEGLLYIINSFTGCIRTIDISEEVYAKILAIPSNDNKLIDLVVTTMNGNLYQFTTSGKWNAMNSYNNRGLNMDSIYLHDYVSMYFGNGKENHYEMIGSKVELPITIVDRRTNQYDAEYNVKVYRKGVLLANKIYHKAGEYIINFELKETGYLNLLVVLENEHKQILSMNLNIHANVEVLNYIKWIVMVPFLILSTIILFTSNFGSPLPL